MRDDFNIDVKRTLAARVGNRCSNPACLALTSGPQKRSAKSLNIGVAAHITAASPGGPRYDSQLTQEDREGIENGIWLCQNCAKLVDNDPLRYSEACLRSWKKQAEDRALAEIGQTRQAPPGTVLDYKEKMEYDAALRLKRAVLGVKNTISSVRSLGSGTDFQAKLTRKDKSLSAFYAELREAEVHWDDEVWKLSIPLKLCALKLEQYIRRYTRQSKHLSDSDLEEIERIIWEDDPNNDPFTLEIESAVDKILSFLDPYLKKTPCN